MKQNRQRQCNLTVNLDLGLLGERAAEVVFYFQAGEPASGMGGPWEDSDPGTGAEIDLVSIEVEGRNILSLWEAFAEDEIQEDLLDELAERQEEIDAEPQERERD